MPTHSTLKLLIDIGNGVTTRREAKTPLSIYSLLRGQVLGEHGDPDHLTKEQNEEWKASVGRFREILDAKLAIAEPLFKKYLDECTMDPYWELWCKLYEEAGIQAGGVGNREAKEYKGHGK